MELIHDEVTDQVQTGNIVVFPWEAIVSLPNLWLSPVDAIIQVGRYPCLIYDFPWSGLNTATKRLVLELYQEVMYVAAPYLCNKEPLLKLHEQEHWYPQKRSINRYDTTYPQE